MPRVTILPAYSGARHGFVNDAPECVTATRIKRAVGCADDSWLYARLPYHADDKACPCYSCVNAKRGWWKRPAWVREADFAPSWYRWIRWNLGARNVRLTLKGGEFFVVVALVDMPTFADQLANRGVHGQRMALAYYGEAYALKDAPRELSHKPLISLDERRTTAAGRVLSGSAH